MYRTIWTTAALAAMAVGQTQVDLRTQSKSVDFSAAISTKPVTTGTSLPSICGVGQMFFLSNAPAGQNVYGCTTANNWTLQSVGGGASGVTVESAGSAVGANSTLNFSGGAGVLYAISNTGSAISIQTSANTAVVPTLASLQSGGTLFCASASGSGNTYTCAMSPTLTAYTAGMLLLFTPNVNGTGGATTLNIDTLGAKAVKKSDGSTNPGASDIVAGRYYPIVYDGMAIRLITVN